MESKKIFKEAELKNLRFSSSGTMYCSNPPFSTVPFSSLCSHNNAYRYFVAIFTNIVVISA